MFYEWLFSCPFLQLKVGGTATNFSWEQLLFQITKPTSKSFSPSLCTLESNFKEIKMPESIYSSKQIEGLSYSYFMILLPEGTFYHNCAVIVAFIKEEKRREIVLLRQCFISDDGSHTPWELRVRQGHENSRAAHGTGWPQQHKCDTPHLTTACVGMAKLGGGSGLLPDRILDCK